MHENDFYDDLSGVLEQSWRLLEQAINDSTSPARTPVLISVSADGLAQGRTVVLRGFNRQQRQLQIYTDVRSAKVAQLQAQPTCTLVVYQPNPMIQLRLSTSALVNQDNRITHDAWAEMPGPNRCNYLTDPDPGSISKGSICHGVAIGARNSFGTEQTRLKVIGLSPNTIRTVALFLTRQH